MFSLSLLYFFIHVVPTIACGSCDGAPEEFQHVRMVRRMQPESLDAVTKPKGPLEWGQINFLQTTDTHGWLEGHLEERNYGADWGDYASFVKHMRDKADELDVDLLLVDTGDMHDGNGLSDITSPNGIVTNSIFTEIDYDLLSIGNHELYKTDVAYLTFSKFAKVYGEKYLTSNVQILNKETDEYEDIGHKYRYFTTKKGLNIMAFGVLFDFDRNSNVSKITKTADMVKEPWFIKAVNYKDPIDLFVVIGHNPVRTTEESSTFGTLYETIRGMRPDVPIQGFGGHTHIRDFVVYDEMSTGIESGKYCETLGWLSMTGIKSPTFKGTMHPKGVLHPTRRAVKVDKLNPASTSEPTKRSRGIRERSDAHSPMLYSRRYLDWNRLTFAYHAIGSQDRTFDTSKGLDISSDITDHRQELNLTESFGCVPRTYCMSCKPFNAEGNIYHLLETEVFPKVVVKEDRADKPRLVIANTGGIRYDLVQGPFTIDDAYIINPFKNVFQYIPDVPYSQASQVLGIMNSGPVQKKRRATSMQANRMTGAREVCGDPPYTQFVEAKRSVTGPKPLTRRQLDPSMITPGYTTVDDFGDDGDDTPHSSIAKHSIPNDVQAQASFPTDGSEPEEVDLVFVDFIGKAFVIPALAQVGGEYTESDIKDYKDFGESSYLREYATKYWQKDMPNCPVGEGIQ